MNYSQQYTNFVCLQLSTIAINVRETFFKGFMKQKIHQNILQTKCQQYQSAISNCNLWPPKVTFSNMIAIKNQVTCIKTQGRSPILNQIWKPARWMHTKYTWTPMQPSTQILRVRLQWSQMNATTPSSTISNIDNCHWAQMHCCTHWQLIHAPTRFTPKPK